MDIKVGEVYCGKEFECEKIKITFVGEKFIIFTNYYGKEDCIYFREFEAKYEKDNAVNLELGAFERKLLTRIIKEYLDNWIVVDERNGLNNILLKLEIK